MRVVCAPDKFRGTLTAGEAAASLAAGVLSVRPEADVLLRPIADGGEGTVDAFVAAGWTPVPVTVAGPTGAPVSARSARSPDGRVVVELAECCGMQRLPGGVPAPRGATSRGVGDAVAAALRAGAREVLIGLGGSASTDGGVGFLAGLGVVLRDAAGAPLPAEPASLGRVASVDLAAVVAGLAGARLTFLVDVTNPLTGPSGAAAVFGPQKGCSPADVAWLEAGLVHWATVLGAAAVVSGAGAAGGVAAGALGVLGGVASVGIESGAATVLAAVGLDEALAGADLVLTGEGSFDAQSLGGKGPVEVVRRADAHGVRSAVVAGRVALTSSERESLGATEVIALTDVAVGDEDPFRDAAVLVARAAARVV